MECRRLKKKAGDKISGKHDIGCGVLPRFASSCNLVWSEEEALNARKKMKELIHQYETLMVHATSKKEKLFIVLGLQKCITEKFLGIKEVRSQVIIQLLALIGLLPLDFLNFLPMHMSGGCGNFVKDLVKRDSFKDENDLIGWNLQFVEELQQIYGTDLTFSMFENATCLIGRKKNVMDIFYHLPWFDDHDDGNTTRMQLCFSYNSTKKTLDGYDGISRKTIISSLKPEDGMICWPRTRAGFIRNEPAYKINTCEGSIFHKLYRSK